MCYVQYYLELRYLKLLIRKLLSANNVPTTLNGEFCDAVHVGVLATMNGSMLLTKLLLLMLPYEKLALPCCYVTL